MAEQTTQEAVAEIWRLFKETDARFKETDARLDQRFRETDARLDRRFRETDDKLRRLESLFGAQWGRLMEALVQSNVLKLFQARGHDVHRLHQRSKAQRNGDTMEIDLILENSREVIVGEVKSVLKIEDVNAFLDDLAEFTNFFPLYQGYQIYGAVAGLEIPAAVARYAYRRGLFVLAVTGEGMVTIQNDDKFLPHDFGVDASTEPAV
ncbi:MAG: hypothetical protein U0350_22570 [Caldilineaceae bacterium]